MAKLTGFLYMLLLLTAQPLVVQGFLFEAIGAVGGVTLAIVGAPIALTAAGFSAGGIAAGSLAAKFMSVAYSANTGIGVLGALQSAGAAGLSTSTVVASGVVGAGAGHYAGSHCGNNED